MPRATVYARFIRDAASLEYTNANRIQQDYMLAEHFFRTGWHGAVPKVAVGEHGHNINRHVDELQIVGGHHPRLGQTQHVHGFAIWPLLP